MRSVIYVPGLGDRMPFGQAAIIWTWRIFGLRAHYLALGWSKKEGFDTKLQRLLLKIDELQKTGEPISLVGISAGASAVLNTYALRPNVASVVCICGKINHPETVHPQRFIDSPDLKDSLYSVGSSLAKLDQFKRKSIMSTHPLADATVPIRDTIIPGAVEKVVHTRGHVFSIFYTIIFRSGTIAKFLKTQEQNKF